MGEGFALVWITLAGVGILSVIGVASEFSFLTISGVVGLAVSLALQNTLSNIISGVLLLSDGVLRLDDSVEYSGVKGVVVKIGLRATWVKTDRGEIAAISNNYLVNGPLVNHTATQSLERKLHFYFCRPQGHGGRPARSKIFRSVSFLIFSTSSKHRPLRSPRC